MLNDLRARLRSAIAQASTTEGALDHAMGLYTEAASLVDALKGFQTECKGVIGEIFVETGQTEAWGSAARCYMTAPAVRVTYDAAALDALCAADDDLAALLAPYRRETVVAGALTIRSANNQRRGPPS